MLLGSFKPATAIAAAQQQAAWAAEQLEWQRREAAYREQLERHYWEQQEAEFQAGVAEYYAARQQHQQQQQRLNQVLYGHGAAVQPFHPAPQAGGCHGALLAVPRQHALQATGAWGAGAGGGEQPEGMECCGPPACSPRQPLAAVSCNLSFGAGGAAAGWPVGGPPHAAGWEWEAAGTDASLCRKRLRDTAPGDGVWPEPGGLAFCLVGS